MGGWGRAPGRPPPPFHRPTPPGATGRGARRPRGPVPAGRSSMRHTFAVRARPKTALSIRLRAADGVLVSFFATGWKRATLDGLHPVDEVA